MMNYKAADKAIKAMNREGMREFGRLKLMKFDQLNVIKEVSDVYRTVTRSARKHYLDITRIAYEDALIEIGWLAEDAKRASKRDITDKWIREWLKEVDPVARYEFDTEADRKKDRLIESLAISNSRDAEIDKALRYWSGQAAWFSIVAVDKASVAAYKLANVKQVEWITERDDRVCEECEELDSRVFDIDAIPPKPHWGCRCWLRPVLDKH